MVGETNFSLYSGAHIGFWRTTEEPWKNLKIDLLHRWQHPAYQPSDHNPYSGSRNTYLLRRKAMIFV